MVAEVQVSPDYQVFVRRVQSLTGIDLAGYKSAQMCRRLLALASSHGAANLVSLADMMSRDAAVLAAFKNFFTINVSEFFRDPGQWDELEKRMLPEMLRAAGNRGVRVWSAGCSFGAEPYTLAMVLEEVAPGRLHSIVATDIDETVLEVARAGRGYRPDVLRAVTPERLKRWFVPGQDGSYDIVPALKSRIRFRKHDLLTSAPETDLDMIVCRNVVIYFTEEAKRSLYGRLFDALRPGGLLFSGRSEIVTGARAIGFEPVAAAMYRRPATAG